MQTTVAQLTDRQKSTIITFLKKQRVGVVASVDPHGDPHASVIYVNTDDDLHITFTTKRETRKYENLSRHNKLMLVVYEASTQTVLQVSGEAEEITSEAEQHEVYKGTVAAAQRTGEDIVPPIAKIAAGAYVGFSVKVDNIWLSDYGWGDNFANAMKHANDPKPSGDPA